MMEQQDLGFCNICGTPSKLICSRCFDTYCSVKCQVDDWPNHRLICIPIPKLIERPKTLRAGLLTKKVSGPSSVRSFARREMNGDAPEVPGLVKQKEEEAQKKVVVPVKAPVVEPCLGLVSSFVALGLNNFAGQLGVVLTENLFTIIVEFPEILSKKYDQLFLELESASEFANGNIENNKMIALKGPSTKFERAIVLKLDSDANAAIIYYCDLGTFDVLLPLPAEIKICPEKCTKLPGKALLIEMTKHVELDREKFLTNFFVQQNIFSFDIRKKENEIYSGKINVNGRDAGEVFLYEGIPDLKGCSAPEWTIKSPSGTAVKIIRFKIEQELRVWVLPADKASSYEGLLGKIGKKLALCKAIPEKNSMVVHVQGNRGGRLLVTKHVREDLVELFDVDNGRIYKCEWNQLKSSTDFVRNLPVYGMMVNVLDAPNLDRFDKEEIMEYLDSIDYRKKEFVLKYDSYSGLGVKLLHGKDSLGQMLVTNFTEKEAAVAELTRKQKEREAEDMKQKILQKEEAERQQKAKTAALEAEKAEKERVQKAKEAEEERLKKEKADADRKKEALEEIERLKKLKEAEIERKKALAAEEERAKNETKKEEIAETESTKPKKSILERLQKLKVQEEKSKIMIQDMNVVPLEVGKTYKFIVTDNGTDGFVGVCPSSAANNEYLQEILDKCEQYVAKVKKDELVGYVPEASEMCLTCFSDGGWYRGKCLSSSESKMLLELVDFGTLYNVDSSKVMPLPESLIKPEPRTHLVSITDSDTKKASSMEVYSQYRLKVESNTDDIYNLVFV